MTRLSAGRTQAKGVSLRSMTNVDEHVAGVLRARDDDEDDKAAAEGLGVGGRVASRLEFVIPEA